MTIFRQQCWFCRKSIRVDKMDWTTIHVGWTDQKPDDVGVMVVLFSATMLVCLIGAFVLPSSSYKGLGIILAGLVVALPFLLRAAHRSRIRHAVEEIGGRVIRIRRLPFWKQDYFLFGKDRIKHDVEYVDSVGFLHKAVCRSGFLHGVEWVSDAPGDSSYARQ